MVLSAKLRPVIVVVAVVGLVFAVARSVSDTRQLLAAEAVCGANGVAWADVDAIADVDAKKVAVECACSRVTETDVATCVERLVPLVDELPGWELNADVARVAGAYLADDGRWPIARQFVEAGLRQEPGNVALNALWLDVVRDRPERELLDEVAQRATQAQHPEEVQRLVASRALRAGDTPLCLRATETASRTSEVDFLVLRSMCLARADRRPDVVALWDAWAEGHSRFVARAYRASILLSEHVGTVDDVSTLQELERDPGDLPPEMKQKAMYVLLAYASKRPELSAYVAEVVERSKRNGAIDPALLESLGEVKAEGDGVALIEVQSDNAVVFVSTDRVDAPLSAVVPVGRVARVPFRPDEVPLRYVVRTPAGTVASGSISRRTPGEKRVTVQEQPASALPAVTLAFKPADGRKRIFVLIPDSWDWRLLNVVRARGEMPAIDAMITAGVSGSVWSEPALTASAMTSLAHPDVDASFGVVALLHEMGGELGGLASVGNNPLDLLSPWLPERADLFATVGAGQHSIVNLLFSHADIDAGRHAVRTGPHHVVTDVAVGRSLRPLNEAEKRVAPNAAEHATHFETTAAQLDLLGTLMDQGIDDVVLLRAESVDLLTHARFHETANGKQDDARSSLYSMYRMIDLRLRELLAKIDADDVFIVMSDHGALTNMQHDNHAVFVAVGLGQGHLDGEPNLRGLPRLLTDLLGIPTTFPDTGFARRAGQGQGQP